MQCTAVTKDGQPCKREATEDGLCYQHSDGSAMRCTATSKRSGQRCQGLAVEGSRQCRMHMGHVNKKGVTHHRFKTGKYSGALPESMAANYQQSRRDKKLLALREEISLLDARIHDTTARAESSPVDLDLFADLLTDLDKYLDLEDIGAAKNVSEALRDATQSENARRKLWRDIEASVDLRRKLTDSENKREAQLKHLMHIEEVHAIVGRIVGVIALNVDRSALREIRAGVNSVLGENKQNVIDGEVSKSETDT